MDSLYDQYHKVRNKLVWFLRARNDISKLDIVASGDAGNDRFDLLIAV